MLGFTAPAIRAEVLSGSSAVCEKSARHLYANSMCIPHVCVILVSCLLALDTIFKPSTSAP